MISLCLIYVWGLCEFYYGQTAGQYAFHSLRLALFFVRSEMQYDKNSMTKGGRKRNTLYMLIGNNIR